MYNIILRKGCLLGMPRSCPGEFFVRGCLIMIVSSKGRYALRIMLDLAQRVDEGYISLKKISEREDISIKYLEAIVALLNKAGMVESLRGKDGGYRLTKPPHEYTVGSIVKLTEGTLAPVSCLECGPVTCSHASRCLTLPVWINIEKMLDDYLEGITLQDLLDGRVRRMDE